MRKFKIDATCRHVSARVSGRWKKVSLPTSLHFSELVWRHPRWPSFLKSPIKITQSAPEILSAPTDHTWDSYLDMRHNCFLLWASLASSKSLWAFLTWAGADSAHRDNGNGLIKKKKILKCISGTILRTRKAAVSSEVSLFVDTRFITLTKM